jgi:hypothetical protein
MEDDNFDLESLPSSITLSSTYTPKSAEESPIDSPFAVSPIKSPDLPPPQPQQPQPEDDLEPEENNDKNYVWVPVDDKWKKILLSDFYVVKDCAPDGNCQFRSLEESLKGSEIKTSHKKLRRLVAEHILTLSDLQFQEILGNYKAEKDSGEFYGDWDPHSIKTKRQLALEVKKPGFNFEGDNTTLSILSSVLNIDIFIFNQNTHTITKIENNNDKFVMLNFIQSGNTGHYKTIGFRHKKNIQTLFKRSELDDEILPLVDKQLFYKKHIEQIYNLYDPFTCNDLISNLELTLGKLSNSDKKLICKLSAKIVMQNEPKPRERRKSKKRSFPKAPKSKSKKSKSKSKAPSTKSSTKTKKSKKPKSKSKSKSKSKKPKSVKRKSVKKSKKSKKFKSVKRKSVKKSKKSKKSKSVKRKSVKKSKKSKSVKRKSKSKSKKSKSVKRKSVKKSKKSKSVKRKSVKKSKKSKRKSKKSKKAKKSKRKRREKPGKE